jgi:ABC-type uncharacterized transport system substrate-binding protein
VVQQATTTIPIVAFTDGLVGAGLVASHYIYRERLADLAVRNRLAWIAGDRDYAEAGCLLSYGPTGKVLIRRSAAFVDRILKGARPADLPVEQPTTFELIINLKTAKALGLTIPQSLLLRADEIIQ